MNDERVLGVDACKGGWVGIALTGTGIRAYFGATIGELVADAEADGRLAVVAIDIPIGLPEKDRRAADDEARKAVGPRHSSVFTTPVRATLDAPTHEQASAINREHTGKGISAQTYGILKKVREVDSWLRGTDHRVVEVHPEVSFAKLADRHLEHPKSTWAGIEERRRLLHENGITIPADLGNAGRRAAVDDVLDAAAAAWTARRVSQEKAETIPRQSQAVSHGLTCAIWC